ncbi:hypothetical protein FA13DRAFT_31690 [Coprinellus micaceus]|uniref:Uncharacterized protein n=1 Tax=Coprinellus micaceus TaxID=71717 RepID=A0A4Y7U1B3_COPMI|nr:hypothetical protein FA13DRAFT_31690 [Coprinellus micaceus]
MRLRLALPDTLEFDEAHSQLAEVEVRLTLSWLGHDSCIRAGRSWRHSHILVELYVLVLLLLPASSITRCSLATAFERSQVLDGTDFRVDCGICTPTVADVDSALDNSGPGVIALFFILTCGSLGFSLASGRSGCLNSRNLVTVSTLRLFYPPNPLGSKGFPRLGLTDAFSVWWPRESFVQIDALPTAALLG